MRKTICATLVAVLAVLAACGGGGDDEPNCPVKPAGPAASVGIPRTPEPCESV